ncbi:hypothetical protein RhiJN_16382 [Ceratobasidium sp. AG-Ba]|nr:hypothetical protein RhiJN_16382 [Ceratobasidium sp. AG-Ba]
MDWGAPLPTGAETFESMREASFQAAPGTELSEFRPGRGHSVAEAERIDKEMVDKWVTSLDEVGSFVSKSRQPLFKHKSQISFGFTAGFVTSHITFPLNVRLGIASSKRLKPVASGSSDEDSSAAVPSRAIIWINRLWFCDIIICVSLIMGVRAVKRSCERFRPNKHGSPCRRAYLRHKQRSKSKLRTVRSAVLCLRASAGLAIIPFFIGLVLCIWTLGKSTAALAIATLSIILVLYLLVTISHLVWKNNSPFTTQLSTFIRSVLVLVKFGAPLQLLRTAVFNGTWLQIRTSSSQDICASTEDSPTNAATSQVLCELLETCQIEPVIEYLLWSIAGRGRNLPVGPFLQTNLPEWPVNQIDECRPECLRRVLQTTASETHAVMAPGHDGYPKHIYITSLAELWLLRPSTFNRSFRGARAVLGSGILECMCWLLIDGPSVVSPGIYDMWSSALNRLFYMCKLLE